MKRRQLKEHCEAEFENCLVPPPKEEKPRIQTLTYW
jgi:hypothetical protein